MTTSWRSPKTLIPDFSKENIPAYPATKFFDQLSFIGDEIVGCFALETSKGIILIDCMNPEQRCIDIIEKGFKDLNLDINNLYAILITHGHGDHFGMAGYFKDKYGAKIYMSKIDYEFAKNMPDTLPWKPITFNVDYFLQDNEELTFGDTKIYTVFTPGHSTGCFSFIIPVTDEGRKHHAALWGGSAVLPDSSRQDYYNSLVKFSSACDKYEADCEIATHPCLDMGLMRLDMIRNITNGVPNPFVIGREGYKYYEKQFYNFVPEYL